MERTNNRKESRESDEKSWRRHAKEQKEKLTEKKTQQSDLSKMYETEDHRWLKRNTNPRKTAALFSLLE